MYKKITRHNAVNKFTIHPPSNQVLIKSEDACASENDCCRNSFDAAKAKNGYAIVMDISHWQVATVLIPEAATTCAA